jgi:hypothetical protein
MTDATVIDDTLDRSLKGPINIAGNNSTPQITM